MNQRYVPAVLSLFMVLGPLGGTALANTSAVRAPAPREVTDGALTLVTPGDRDTITSTRQPVFSGTSTTPKDIVTVWPEHGHAYCSAVVGDDGNWSCTPNRDLPVGRQRVTVNETTLGSATSQGLVRIVLFIKPDADTSTDKPCPEKDDKHQYHPHHFEW
jgi:hypothetical protein